MRILLDTHILIWVIQDDEKLSSKASDMIKNPYNEIFYSSINIWEAQIKYLKKTSGFNLSGDLLNDLALQSGFSCLPVLPEHAVFLKTLSYSSDAPRPHKDPFDRMLISQAKAENMVFLTHDELLPFYKEPCVFLV